MTQNFDLLKSLYCIHSKSGNEKKMRKFIKKWIKANVPTAEVTQDESGNLFVTRGEAVSYPCICSHMDQVQDFHSNDFKAVETDDIIFGYSPKMRQHQGLGADDKNGIWVALLCLQKYEVLKCAFFVGEEIGCVGSSACDVEWFSDCRFCAQVDRRGHSDLITEIGWSPICSDEFIEATRCEEYGYKPEEGLMTDVEALRTNGVTCSCVNMSCGYYEPHTDREYTVKADLLKCLAFVEHLIEDCTEVYLYEEVKQKHSINNWWSGGWQSPREIHEDEVWDMSNELYGAIRRGEVHDEATLQQFINDFDGVWETLTEKDYKDCFDSCKDDILEEYDEEAIGKLA